MYQQRRKHSKHSWPRGRAIAFNPHGRVLLVQNPKGRWHFPGGHIEHGEDTCDAAVRETMEETGVTITPLSFLMDDGTHFYYLCRTGALNAYIAAPDEIRRAEFVPAATALQLLNGSSYDGLVCALRALEIPA